MLNIQNSREAKRIHQILLEQFGFTDKLPYVFLLNNKDRIYIVHRDIEMVITEKFRVDSIGLYFGTLEGEQIRLSLEGAQIIGPHATKNIIILSDKQFEEYLTGVPVDLTDDQATLGPVCLIKHDNDFAGSCKVSGNKLVPFLPKSRRLKVVNQ